MEPHFDAFSSEWSQKLAEEGGKYPLFNLLVEDLLKNHLEVRKPIKFYVVVYAMIDYLRQKV